jgi:hypothetical protein
MKTTHCFYNFEKDLSVAQVTEKVIAKLLELKYNLTLVKIGRTNAYDLAMQKKNSKKVFTFEIKEDFTHARTGNIGVEFESWGRLAGISVSQADYYVFRVHNSDKTSKVWIIRTETLKQIINEKLYSRIVVGGDKGSNSKNYLFKDSVFFSYAKELIA